MANRPPGITAKMSLALAMLETNTILHGDALMKIKELPDESIDCVITSPPYWGLRDYGHDGQLGQEPELTDYVKNLCNVFDEVQRVLKPSGTVWVNIGDTYSTVSGGMRDRANSPRPKYGKYQAAAKAMALKQPKTKYPPKTLLQIPARFAIEMTDRGWILRNEIIWHKPNVMPQSIKDRFTVDYEKIFFFTKRPKYYFAQQFEPSKDPVDDARRISKAKTYRRREQGGNSTFNSPDRPESELLKMLARGRNMRTVWKIATKPFRDAHFATFPKDLVVPMISAGCPAGGVVLDPFFGSGTTGLVAKELGRYYIGIEINQEFIAIAEKRLAQELLV